MKAKVNVRVNGGVVNSVFLVQLRKSDGRRSREFAPWQEKFLGHVRARLRALSEEMKRVKPNLLELAAGLSTGLAQEMQKAVVTRESWEGI